MKYSTEIYEAAEKELARKRAEVRANHERELEVVYKKHPRLLEIDKEVKELSLTVLHKLAQNPLADETSDMQKRSDLIAEREAIIAKNGIYSNVFAPAFFCDECNDTGVVRGGYVMCKCKKDAAKKFAVKFAGMGDLLLPSFDDFDTTLYSDEVSKGKSVTNRQMAACILVSARQFKSGNALIRGGAGLGKTFTAECVANEWLKNGKIVCYYSASRLFLMLNEHIFNRKDTTEDTRNQVDLIHEADLLIIDDLGTEFRNSFTESMFFDILNSRLMNGKSMIITTNLNDDNIRDVYSERVLSRIDGYFKAWEFSGSDIRKQKKMRKQ